MKALAAVFLALFIAVSTYSAYGTIDMVEARVTNTERLVTKEDSKWLVMTDVLVMENTDTIFHLKFNSSDIQAKLEVGNTYEFTTYGWRVPFLSMYPNIIGVERVE